MAINTYQTKAYAGINRILDLDKPSTDPAFAAKTATEFKPAVPDNQKEMS